MEAKDTVIKLNCGGILSDIEVEYYNRGAAAQAEITWDIAEKEGMRRVVEWVEKHSHCGSAGGASSCVATWEWRAQLKDWGLAKHC